MKRLGFTEAQMADFNFAVLPALRVYPGTDRRSQPVYLRPDDRRGRAPPEGGASAGFRLR